MKSGAALRELIAEQKIILAPGCYDCLSAKILENLGYNVLYLTGYGAEASKLGLPDLGFMNMIEMAELARNITNVVKLPLISDIDTGYGGVLNIQRTIRAFEQAGVAGVHMEDQALPKKCSLMEGRKIVSAENMVAKIKVAVQSKIDPDFVLIARSDAKAITGFKDLLRRLNLYLAAGADLLMVAGEDYTLKEYEKLGSEFQGKIAIVIGSLKINDNNLPIKQYGKMGIKIAIHPTVALGAAAAAMKKINGTLLMQGFLSLEQLNKNTMNLDDINKILSLDMFEDILNKYSMN